VRRFLGCDFQAERSVEHIHTTPAGKPHEIFGTETQISSRREQVMSWFGS
jgi:hypothetical protein